MLCVAHIIVLVVQSSLLPAAATVTVLEGVQHLCLFTAVLALHPARMQRCTAQLITTPLVHTVCNQSSLRCNYVGKQQSKEGGEERIMRAHKTLHTTTDTVQ